MPPTHRRPQRIALLLVAALWLVAFSLACRLAPAHTSATGQTTPSLAQTLFGDTRVAIGAKLYTQADVYFHRGVPHKQERAFGDDLYQRLRDEVSPSQHVHLEGANDIREIMPWLDLATRANPGDSESYLVAAFWLSSAAKRHDLALAVLDQAQCSIPYSYEIQLAKGRIFLHTGRYLLARQAFNAALAYWEKTADPTRDDQLLDKAEALLYRALLQEIDGEISAAISDLREMLRISPDRPAMQERLKQLESGEPGQPSALNVLQTVMRDDNERHHACEHEEDEEDHT